MALICPVCRTENRSVAKFCIECVAPLPTEFAPTQLVSRPSEPDQGMPSALAAFAAATPSTPGRPLWDVPAAAAPAPPSHGGIGIGLAIAGMLLMGTLGWLAAGGALWPHRGEVVVVQPVPIEPPPPVAIPTAEGVPAPYDAPPVEALPLPAPPPAPVKAPRPERIFARCDELGFIAASRCKVEQCSKPAYHARPECRPVLDQLRLMEEKRNPTMAN
jgi:hypothetical protein